MKYLVFSRYNGRNAVVSADDAVVFAAQESADLWTPDAEAQAKKDVAALQLGDFCCVGNCCATPVKDSYPASEVYGEVLAGQVA